MCTVDFSDLESLHASVRRRLYAKGEETHAETWRRCLRRLCAREQDIIAKSGKGLSVLYRPACPETRATQSRTLTGDIAVDNIALGLREGYLSERSPWAPWAKRTERCQRQKRGGQHHSITQPTTILDIFWKLHLCYMRAERCQSHSSQSNSRGGDARGRLAGNGLTTTTPLRPSTPTQPKRSCSRQDSASSHNCALCGVADDDTQSRDFASGEVMLCLKHCEI